MTDGKGNTFEVYNLLGYGMAEENYQQSFYRPDLLVFGEIVVELKALVLQRNMSGNVPFSEVAISVD